MFVLGWQSIAPILMFVCIGMTKYSTNTNVCIRMTKYSTNTNVCIGTTKYSTNTNVCTLYVLGWQSIVPILMFVLGRQSIMPILMCTGMTNIMFILILIKWNANTNVCMCWDDKV